MSTRKLHGLAVLMAVVCSQASFALDNRLREVDPFIGTSYMGNCYPGATVPFGMVQPSPDSRSQEGEWHRCSGYKHEDPIISGFSQTHLSGTGCRGTMDILIQAFSGDGERVNFGGLKDFGSEVASPGYYAVSLTNFGVRAEVTASQRVARYRWTYEKGRKASVYLDLMWTWSPVERWYRPPIWEMSTRIESCDHELSDDQRELSGYYHVMGWLCRDVSFVIRFSRPYRAVRPLARRPGEKAPRYVFDFDLEPGESLEAEVALSLVDLNGARKNLAAEGGLTFDAVRRNAEAKWLELLSRVDVGDVTPRERRIFYTSLYHLFVQPNNIADVDGRYRADGVVGRSRCPDKAFYSGFSLWDTFRAAHPLYTILVPERVDAFCESLLACARVSGPLPIIPYFGFDTGCMVGYHSVPVIVDAYLKGFRGFDPKEAFAAIDYTLSNDHPDRPKSAVAIVKKYGYIPYDVASNSPSLTPFKASGLRESASRLMEMCYDDAAAARFAKALGQNDRANFYTARSRLWTNIFDRATGFVRGKDSKGQWRTPFDPLLGGYLSDFTEASPWVYTWHVMQEPQRLIDLLGGREAFVRKLDGLFTAPEGPAYHDGTGRIGQYAHGNEPSHHIAYFYALVGRGDRTAEIVREVFDRFYGDNPNGVCGNEDGGQMSAWYIFSAMGCYPFDPCGGEYVIGAPQVPKMTLRTGDVEGGAGNKSRTFTMVAKNLSRENKYVKSVKLNGKPLARPILRHVDIMRGGILEFEMAAQPFKELFN